MIDLPLRAFSEGLLRPRVARAQKIIRLHPLRHSASKKGNWPLLPLFVLNRNIKRIPLPIDQQESKVGWSNWIG